VRVGVGRVALFVGQHAARGAGAGAAPPHGDTSLGRGGCCSVLLRDWILLRWCKVLGAYTGASRIRNLLH
jgi:hypothetical protein